MKAYEIQSFGIDELSLVERDVPKPGPREVLVKLHSTSVNFRDLMVVKGTYNPRMKLPAVPFSDGAGEVVEVGGEVSEWAVGDHVMPIFAQHWFDGDPTEAIRKTSLGGGAPWDGTLREHAVFGSGSLIKMPEHLSFDEAATLPCAGLTAWNALVAAGSLKPGETVMTLGTGGVSVFAAQLAKLAGARLISTSSSNEKLEKLKEIGADETINYKEQPDWEKTVLGLTGGLGVDHAVEVGGADTLPRSIKATRFGGHIALIGALSGSATFDPVSVFMKSVRVSGIYTGSKRVFEQFNKAVSVNRLRPVIDRVFSFDEARQALRHMERGSHFGKIVIRISE